MRLFFSAFPLIIIISTCAAFASASGTAKEIEKNIPPGKVHEECMELGAPRKLNYSFKSKSPLNFNIHYHAGKDVFYPVKRDEVAGIREEFRPTSKQEYCLMWSNSEKVPVHLSYTYTVE